MALYLLSLAIIFSALSTVNSQVTNMPLAKGDCDSTVTFQGMSLDIYSEYGLMMTRIDYLALNRVLFDWAESYDSKVSSINPSVQRDTTLNKSRTGTVSEA